VFWFVPVLFLTQQLGNFLLARFSVRVNVSIVAGMLCLGFLNDWYLDAFKFPYNLNVVAAAVPFYFCGFLLRHYKLIWVRRAAALVAICGWALVLLGYPNYYDMKNAFYGMPFVTFASALAIVITMLDVFAKLPYWRLLADAGKASLVIMYLHQGVQIFILDHFSHSVVLRLLAALFIPLIVYYLSLRWSFTRALLLGSKADLAELWNYRVHRLR
jgi:fucose 4-O-acetylase-like acetyltransferase